MRAMGFTTIATIGSVASSVATALPKAFEAKASYEEAENLKLAANEKERIAARKAAAIDATSTANQIRASRNAHAELARVRTDAAVSNTLQEGSTYLRGVDMATRLQDEISSTANEQLERANTLRYQAAYDAWDLRNQARRSKLAGKAAVASGIGSLISGLTSSLGGAMIGK